MELAWRILSETYAVFSLAAPYLLLGLFLAGLTHVLLPTDRTERWLGHHRGWKGIVAAALAGIPLPLCSCSVIPVATALRRNGAGKGATTSFLISTPETGLDSIAVTYALMDPLMTVFRPLASFLTAVMGGLAVHRLTGPDTPPAAPSDSKSRAAACADNCCAKGDRAAESNGAEAKAKHRRGAWMLDALRFGLLEIPRDIFWSLIIGFAGSGLIGALVPQEFILRYLGNEAMAILVMLVVGLPLYVCASASTPIAAALILKGLSPGAAVVFLLAGPASNVTTMIAVKQQMGWRVLAIYLISIAVMSVLMGLLLNAIYHVFMGGQWHMAVTGGRMISEEANLAATIAVAAILAWCGVLKVRARLGRRQSTASA